MQQLLRRLILFLSLAATVGILPRKAFATHSAGADISYTCVGGNTFRIDLKFYRDCSGSNAPDPVALEFRSISCNQYFVDTLHPDLGTGNEITYPCPGLTTTCDDPQSTNPGIQEWKYSKVITFPNQCADWVISWTYCCRNCDITTMVQTQPCVPGSNPPMYISTKLDNLNYNCNSSPHFTNLPVVFICVGQNFTYNHGAVDPDGDSLSYELVNPLISATDSIPFIPGYSATNPITSSPALAINPTTGDITCTPTQMEVGVLSVLVREYRNGVQIGEVVRDMEIYVRPCNNSIPTATGMNGTTDHDTTVCPGTNLCFDVFSNDADVGQIVTMTWNHAITGAVYNVSGFPYPTGNFCWTPTTADISTIPHQFTVTVVDNACPNNGYQTYSFSIKVTGPQLNVNKIDITCNGSNNGSISVVPQIPGSYSYLWNPGGATTPSISNLNPGTYSVVVYDSSTGCTSNFSDSITDPPLMRDSAYQVSPSCTQTNSGIAAVAISGGVPPYIISWNTVPISNNDTISNAAPGTYIVTVSDQRNCVHTDTVTIDSTSSSLFLTIIASSLPCSNSATGIAAVSVSGGTPGYTYLWGTTPPQNNDTAFGLLPGPYSIKVTDSLGCSVTDVANVTSPLPLALVGSAQGASCTAPDGIAIISISGGTPGYAISWTGYPGITDDSLVGVLPGLYTVHVVDTNGCSDSLQVLVGSLIISTTAGAASLGCHDDSAAVAVATASGGVAPYIFDWTSIPPGMPTQSNDTATNLPPGQYLVTIHDSNNCMTVDTVNIPNPVLMNLSVTKTDAFCNGDSSGTATANASGGGGSYTYTWTPYGGTSALADSLNPGTYYVTVTDAVGCVMNDSAVVGQNNVVTITIDSLIQPDCNGTNTGAIYLSVTGGSGVYTYVWTPGTWNTQDITNITAGNYSVVVTDQGNCTAAQQITLTQPIPPSVDAGNDTAICIGNSIQLHAQALAPGMTGTWSSLSINTFNDIHDPNAIIGYAPPGMNYLTWSIVDSNGCTNMDNVSVFNFFNNVSAGTDINLCGLNPIQLNATHFTGFTGIWSTTSTATFDDDTLYNTIAHINNLGIETLIWTISNTACSGSDSMVVTTLENPTADAGVYSTVCEDKVDLIALQPNVGSGIWSVQFPGVAHIVDSSQATTEAQNLIVGNTIFIWTVTNGFCVVSDTVSADYDDACELQLPTAFSPNGDSYNDGYEILGIEGYKENEFRVFNRWGNEVFTKANYQNTDWVGQNNSGDDLPEGTYFVILVIKSKNIIRNTFVDLRRYIGKN